MSESGQGAEFACGNCGTGIPDDFRRAPEPDDWTATLEGLLAEVFTIAKNVVTTSTQGATSPMLRIYNLLNQQELRAPEPETEWEYGWEADLKVRAALVPRGPRILLDEQPNNPEGIAAFPRGRRIRRRKAGPWEPVEPTGKEGSEDR